MTPTVNVLRYAKNMRADRLLSLLLTLQTEGKVKARELARRLGVSPRTIYRDLDVLTAAGVPVYAEPGPTGGVALLNDYKTQLTGLSSAELQTLFFGKPPALLKDLGLSNVFDAAQLKRRRSLRLHKQGRGTLSSISTLTRRVGRKAETRCPFCRCFTRRCGRAAE